MTERLPLARRKVSGGQWDLRPRDDYSRVVAVVSLEGTRGRDDYPWGYYLADGWTVPEGAPRWARSSGVTDTMGTAVEKLQEMWLRGLIVEKKGEGQ